MYRIEKSIMESFSINSEQLLPSTYIDNSRITSLISIVNSAILSNIN
jgi:hypothetical protein